MVVEVPSETATTTTLNQYPKGSSIEQFTGRNLLLYTAALESHLHAVAWRHVSTIRFKVTDVWRSFRADDSPLVSDFRSRYDATESESPDIVFFSVYGEDHLNYPAARKVFFSHEAVYPDFRYCDYAASFYHLAQTPRHLYWPNYLPRFGYSAIEEISKRHVDVEDGEYQARDATCTFVASNNTARVRRDLFRALSSRVEVLSGGKFANNIGGPLASDESYKTFFEFIGRGRFNLACENSRAPGYVTEKIVAALISGTVPIFWGDDYVRQLFNPDCFVNADDFADLDELVEHVVTLDQDLDKWLHMRRQPVFADTKVPEILRLNALQVFVDAIVDDTHASESRLDMSDAEVGALKGSHRRHLLAPMSQTEQHAFDETREEYRRKGLM